MAIVGCGGILFRGGGRQVRSSAPALSFLVQQQRWATEGIQEKSNHAKATELNNEDKRKLPTDPVIYEGSMSAPLRAVKLLSASSFVAAVIGGPIVTFMTSPELSMLMKGALSTTMVVLSASTTFALHWIASPYVHKMKWIPGNEDVDVEMLSWMATTSRRRIKLSDVKTPYTQRPLVTFVANNRYYYVDKDNFPDEVLLNQLLPEGHEDLSSVRHEE